MHRGSFSRCLLLESSERIDALFEDVKPLGHHLKERFVIGVGLVKAGQVDATLPGEFQALPREGEIAAQTSGTSQVEGTGRANVIEIGHVVSLEKLSQ